MRIHVNTDRHIAGGLGFSRRVGAVVRGSLGRFADRITRVEVHLSDESSTARSCDVDKRCLLEARLAGRRPISVSHQSATVDQALAGAADKLKRRVDRAENRSRTVGSTDV